MGRSSVFACLLSIASMHTAFAVNGIAVSTACYNIGAEPSPGWQHILRGSIVKFTIQNNAVSRCDTIFRYSQGGMAQYPAINLEGTKVAFFRWGVSAVKQSDGKLHWVPRPGALPNPVQLPDTNWISVMNIDGTGLQNLVMVGPPSLEAGEGYAALEWPCGDWIYYEKPTNSGEIWRVHCENPLLNELVVKFVRRPELLDTAQQMDEYTLMFRRFSLSIDGRFCGAQMLRYVNNTAFCFPPANGDITTCWPSDHGVGGCNMSISAGGRYFAHYLYGEHCNTEIEQWSGLPTASINQGHSSFSGQCGSEMIRWSVNSDKWLCQIYSSGVLDQTWTSYANQIIMNRLDGTKIRTSSNAANTGLCNDAGDFWIDGGTSTAGKYEDSNGNWTAVDPVVARDQTAPSAPGNCQAQARGSHAVALTWGASADAESGVFCYLVYRDGTRIGTVTGLAFADSGLRAGASYAYQVSALNRGTTESAKSSAAVTMPADAQGPAVLRVDAAQGTTALIVFFDEPVDAASGQTAANYTFTGGISTSAAAVSADRKSAVLTVSAMSPGTDYTLTIHNVLDTAAPPNAASATSSFRYQGLAHGLAYETYTPSCGYDGVPNLAGLTPAKKGAVRNFDLSNRGTACAMRFTGFLSVPTTGNYSIIVNAYYSANVTLDGVRAITFGSNDYSAPTKIATKNLAAGMHPLIVDVSAPGGEPWLFVWYEGPDGIRHRIPNDMLFRTDAGGSSMAQRSPWYTLRQTEFVVRQAAGYLEADVAAAHGYDLALVSPGGSIVRSCRGMRPACVRIPAAGLAPGVYFVKVFAKGTAAVRPVVVR